MDTIENLGNRIKKYRISIKMTQQEFAKRLGVTGASVSAYENGTRYPSLDIIVKIAKVLNITTDELLTGKREKVYLDVAKLDHNQRDFIAEMIRTFEEYNAMKAVISNDKKLMEKYKLFLETP